MRNIMVRTFETEYIWISQYVSYEKRKSFEYVLCSKVQGVKYERKTTVSLNKLETRLQKYRTVCNTLKDYFFKKIYF